MKTVGDTGPRFGLCHLASASKPITEPSARHWGWMQKNFAARYSLAKFVLQHPSVANLRAHLRLEELERPRLRRLCAIQGDISVAEQSFAIDTMFWIFRDSNPDD